MRWECVASSLCLLLSLSCRTDKPSDYLARGNAFFAQGKYQEASLNYRKAISLDSRLGEAHYRLGLAEIKQQRTLQAYRALTASTALMPDHLEAQTALGDLALSAYLIDSRRPKALHRQVEAVAERLLDKDPGSFDGLRLSGALQLGAGDPRRAVTLLEKAHAAKPDHADVVLALTQALSQADRFPEAEQLGERFLAANPEFMPLYEALYLQYTARSRWADAERVLRTQAEKNPRQAASWLRLAGHYLTRKQPRETQAALAKLLDNPGDFPRAHLWVGDFYSQAGAAEDAILQYQRCASATPADARVCRNRIAEILIAQGRYGEARKMVESILAEWPQDEEARRRIAFLRLESDAVNELDAALGEWRAIAEKNPRDAAARFYLGRSLQRKGDDEQALREFHEALRVRRDYVAPRVAITEIALARRKPREALQNADEILKLAPSHARAKALRAAALMALGRHEEARSGLARSLQASPQDREARLQLGLLELTQKRYQEAEVHFGQLLGAGDADPRAVAGLADAYTGRNQLDRALQLLADETSKPNAPPALRELLAVTGVRAGRWEIAVDQLRRVIADNPAAVESRLRLAEVFRMRGDFDAARETLAQAQEAAPKDPRPLMLAASLEQEAGNSDRALVLYRRALQQRPNDPLILNNLAFLLADRGENLDEALRLAQQALRVAPNEPRFADTLGWIYLKKKMPDAAMQTFEKLVRAHPENPTFRYHLGAALLEQGQKDRARAELKEALARKPSAQQAARIGELLAKNR